MKVARFLKDFHDDFQFLQLLSQTDRYSEIWTSRGDCFAGLLGKMRTAMQRSLSQEPQRCLGRARRFEFIETQILSVPNSSITKGGQMAFTARVHAVLSHVMAEEKALAELGFDARFFVTHFTASSLAPCEALEMLLAVAVDQLFKACAPSLEQVFRTCHGITPEFVSSITKNYNEDQKVRVNAQKVINAYAASIRAFERYAHNPDAVAHVDLTANWQSFYNQAFEFAQEGFATTLRDAIRYHVTIRKHEAIFLEQAQRGTKRLSFESFSPRTLKSRLTPLA